MCVCECEYMRLGRGGVIFPGVYSNAVYKQGEQLQESLKKDVWKAECDITESLGQRLNRRKTIKEHLTRENAIGIKKW